MSDHARRIQPQGMNTSRSSSLQRSPRYTGIPTFFRCEAPHEEAWAGTQIGLVGVPFDGGTTNRPGARHGPRAVRERSTMLAPFNQSTGVDPFELCTVRDLGDVWPAEPFELERALEQITPFFEKVSNLEISPISVGGDHSASLAVLRGLRHHPLAEGRRLALVQFDAHCDTGMDYMGSRYHHGSPFSRAVEEGLLDPTRCVQIGIRGPINSPDLWSFSRDTGMKLIDFDKFEALGVSSTLEEVRRTIGDHPCYVTFDIDALDPAFAPGTGTPVAGGFTMREAQRLVRGLRGLNVVGADLMEVSPPWDACGITAFHAACLVQELVGVVADRFARTPPLIPYRH